MSNVVEFKRKVSVPTLIQARYEELNGLLNQNLPSAMTIIDREWFNDWLCTALDSLSVETYTAIVAEDESVYTALLTGFPILLRLLNAARFDTMGVRKTVAVVDGFEEPTEEGHYPTPMVFFFLGEGVILHSRFYIFDGEITPEASLKQRHVNRDHRTVNWIDYDNTNDNLMDGTILHDLINTFYVEALSMQRGWAVDDREDAVAFSFRYPTSPNTIQEWSLVIKKEHFDVTLTEPVGE